MAFPNPSEYGSSSGTVRHVRVSPTNTTGTKIADITVNGTTKELKVATEVWTFETIGGTTTSKTVCVG